MTLLVPQSDVFRQLHQSGCFVMPNAWDRGSARLLARLGFPALATTSCGFAWSRGCRDNQVSLMDTLTQLQSIVEAVALPIHADFEGGFATTPAEVAMNVLHAAATGIAGLSIEDSTGNSSAPLFDFVLAVERIAAAREAIERSESGILLTARSEGFVAGRPDLGDTIRRLSAYASAGADCVFAPGIRSPIEIVSLVEALTPTPVNVLIGSDFASVAELAAMGVRRVSVGGALARAAWTGFLQTAAELREHGTLNTIDHAVAFDDLECAFARDSVRSPAAPAPTTHFVVTNAHAD